jgi:hypothetical protein
LSRTCKLKFGSVNNTAVGNRSLFGNIAGINNTGVGTNALYSNSAVSGDTTEGIPSSFNTAVGADALFSNDAGAINTGVCYGALRQNTTASGNTAIGVDVLFSNSTGEDNTASGLFALSNNIAGSQNTANGAFALQSNDGDNNTAVGSGALNDNTTGSDNTANGAAALRNNISGSGNIALGFSAGGAVTNASNVIAIGSAGQDVSNSCFIGQIYTNVQPQVGIDPDLVTITSSGRLGRANVSSRRYKHHIHPMDKASETIYALKPVSFRYHKEYDATQTLAFGLIAEEVAEVYPDLVGRNHKGRARIGALRTDQRDAAQRNF